MGHIQWCSCLGVPQTPVSTPSSVLCKHYAHLFTNWTRVGPFFSLSSASNVFSPIHASRVRKSIPTTLIQARHGNAHLWLPSREQRRGCLGITTSQLSLLAEFQTNERPYLKKARLGRKDGSADQYTCSQYWSHGRREPTSTRCPMYSMTCACVHTFKYTPR